MKNGLRGRGGSTPHGLQTVFRIKGTKARTKVNTNQEGLPKTTFNARRAHRKSRIGCQNCKQRRVKCDENREGGCERCRNHGVDCDYLAIDVDAECNENNSSNSEQATPISMSTSTSISLTTSNPSSAPVSPASAEYAPLTNSLSPATPFKYAVPITLTPYWQTLRHFEMFTCPTITSTDGLRIFEGSVLAIANNSDYLMHAVLGTAAAHLAWKAELRGASVECRQHRRTEAYHWQRAIGMFRERLDTLDQRTSETVDALISTCMLLGIHSYFLADEADEKSFVWRQDQDRPDGLRWLSVQSGFSLLLRKLGGRAALSVWLEVFKSAVPGEAGLQVDLNAAGGMARDFLDLCNIDTQTTVDTNPYMQPIQDLFALLQRGPPTMAGFAPLMAFMGRLVGRFQDLLVLREPAAMLIVAYWLTLMHQLDLWWIKLRSRRECIAIVEFLQYSSDARVQRLLEFPISHLTAVPPFESGIAPSL